MTEYKAYSVKAIVIVTAAAAAATAACGKHLNKEERESNLSGSYNNTRERESLRQHRRCFCFCSTKGTYRNTEFKREREREFLWLAP
jgi:hypothetical protein